MVCIATLETLRKLGSALRGKDKQGLGTHAPRLGQEKSNETFLPSVKKAQETTSGHRLPWRTMAGTRFKASLQVEVLVGLLFFHQG